MGNGKVSSAAWPVDGSNHAADDIDDADAIVADTVDTTAPAGGTGDAGGAWDTSGHRDTAIATINDLVTEHNALVADVTALRGTVQDLLATLRDATILVP